MTSTRHDPFADLDIPEALQDSLDRHRRHVGQLVETLRGVGTSDLQIETSVSVMVESYKAELLHALKALVR